MHALLKDFKLWTKCYFFTFQDFQQMYKNKQKYQVKRMQIEDMKLIV